MRTIPSYNVYSVIIDMSTKQNREPAFIVILMSPPVSHPTEVRNRMLDTRLSYLHLLA